MSVRMVRRPGSASVVPIVIGAAITLSLSMGLRQSLGIFMQPLTRDVQISVSDFTLVIALQNLAWGLFQPFAGASVDRFGYRAIMLVGAVCYGLGLFLLASASGFLSVLLGAGLLIGIALACTATAITLSVATRVVTPARRSMILGLVSGLGSLGSAITAPVGQMLSAEYGWRLGVAGLAVLALVMLPSAWVAGRVDTVATAAPAEKERAGAGAAALAAFRSGPFMIMTLAYSVCGMQLVFLTTHLPSYLQICGMDPMLSAEALGTIGAFNVVGSLFFGWAGGRWNKLVLLGLIYILRSLVLAAYFSIAPTPAATLLFAALMGFLWLGVAPLVAGAVAEMFGIRWQAMIQGIAFVGHQIGSVIGAFGGGLIYDALGSYDMAWRAGAACGLTMGAVQVIAALLRPPGDASPGPAFRLKPAAAAS